MYKRSLLLFCWRSHRIFRSVSESCCVRLLGVKRVYSSFFRLGCFFFTKSCWRRWSNLSRALPCAFNTSTTEGIAGLSRSAVGVAILRLLRIAAGAGAGAVVEVVVVWRFSSLCENEGDKVGEEERRAVAEVGVVASCKMEGERVTPPVAPFIIVNRAGVLMIPTASCDVALGVLTDATVCAERKFRLVCRLCRL